MSNGLTTIPREVDGELGVDKQDITPAPNLLNYTSAAEHNALKRLVKAMADRMGLVDGSQPGTIEQELDGAGVGSVIYANQSAENAAYAAHANGDAWFRSDLPARVIKTGSDRLLDNPRVFFVDRYVRWNDTASDHTAAFLRARDAAETAYESYVYNNGGGGNVNLFGGTIVFSGIRKLRAPLLFSKPIALRGTGERSSILLWDAALVGDRASTAIQMGATSGGNIADWQSCGLSDFVLKALVPTDNTGIGVHVSQMLHCVIERMTVEGWMGTTGAGVGGRGLVLSGASQHTAISDVHLLSSYIGFDLESALACAIDNLKINQQINGAYIGARFRAGAATALQWDRGLVQGLCDTGIAVVPDAGESVTALSVNGVHFELDCDTFIKVDCALGNVNELAFRGNDFVHSNTNTHVHKVYDLAGAIYGFTLQGNHYYYGANGGVNQMMKARSVLGGHVFDFGLGTWLTSDFDVDSTNHITWYGNNAMGIGTYAPPTANSGIQIGALNVVPGSGIAAAVRTNGGIGMIAYGEGVEPYTTQIGDTNISTASGKLRRASVAGNGSSTRGTYADVPAVHRVTGITASTTQTQGQGALTGEENVLATVAHALDTNTLPNVAAWVAKGRSRCRVVNAGANTAQLFPDTGDNLGEGTNAATTIAVGDSRVFVISAALTWTPEVYSQLAAYPRTNLARGIMTKSFNLAVGAARATVLTNTDTKKVWWFLRATSYIEFTAPGDPSSGNIDFWVGTGATLRACSINFGGAYSTTTNLEAAFLRPGEVLEMSTRNATGGSVKSVVTVGVIALPDDTRITRSLGTVTTSFADVMVSGRRVLDAALAKMGEGTGLFLVFNNDTVSHIYEWQLKNGGTVIFLQKTTAAAGATVALNQPIALDDAQWNGWTLQLCMLEAVTTTAPTYCAITVPTDWDGPV